MGVTLIVNAILTKLYAGSDNSSGSAALVSTLIFLSLSPHNGIPGILASDHANESKGVFDILLLWVVFGDVDTIVLLVPD